MAKKAGSPSKSEAIRNYKAAHPDAGPKAIAESLTKDGTKVSAQFVSTVLSNARKKAGKRRGRRGGRRAAAGNATLHQLVLAKKLAARMGGVQQARQALDTLAKLRN